MIRLIITALFLGIFLVLSIPLMLIEELIGRKNPSLKDTSSLAIVQWAFRVILFLSGAKIDYIGRENVPTDVPVLYIGNHYFVEHVSLQSRFYAVLQYGAS
jgi:1-acyl-sn-glycerol-3-phosphate acyltransferase